MRRSGAVVLVAAVLGGCGSGGGSNVPKSWQRVDSCLEQHPSFVGNVAADDTRGPGGRGTLSVEGSGGAIANAFRFKSHAAAVAAERGIGPPGPTVTFFGNIALEINAGTSSSADAAIAQCFSQVYG